MTLNYKIKLGWCLIVVVMIKKDKQIEKDLQTSGKSSFKGIVQL